MTNKEIIIDGADVSGCEFLSKKDLICDCICAKYTKTPVCIRNTKCKNNPNCYYKQLQRKEHECEIKQKTLEIQKSWIDDLEFQIQTLKTENEKLEKQLTTCLAIQPTDVEKQLFLKDRELTRYKQALNNINKIAAYLLEIDNELDLSEVVEKIDEIKKISEIKDA